MKYLFLPVALSLSLLPACAFKKSAEKASEKPDTPGAPAPLAPEAAAPGPVSQEGLVPFSARLESGSEANDYRVILNWEAKLPSLALRRRGADGSALQIELPPGTVTFEDRPSVPGIKYNYALVALAGAQTTELNVATVDIPRDRVVEGDLAWNDLGTGYGRVFLRAGSRLWTGGQAVQLVADEIVSEGGVIITFPKGQTAGPGAIGKSGGRIDLHAHRMRGLLRVEGRGENGGTGAKGQDGATGGRGAPGDDAYVLGMVCMRQAGEGKRGLPGESGHRGQRGASGGDSAQVRIRVDNPSDDFRVEFDLQSGEGGAGGPGGEGGSGGLGGEQGMNFPVCGQGGGVGPYGPSGASGPVGEAGSAGAVFPICQVGTGFWMTCPFTE
ncbi:MAG: hypothetical protein JST16_08125 [Bdellovibrionales bacterium]|nr:hypothetical protein [Bdellovibrionales bacterium]